MPEILHPALVHLPLGLAMAMPFLLLLMVILDAKGKMTRQAWALILLLQAFITAGAFAAMKTGGMEEELVERGIAKAIIHEHEEAAELFTWASVGLLALSVLPVLSLGASLRRVLPFVLLGLSVVVLALGLRAGKLGGALVWTHHASAARVGLALPAGAAPAPADSFGVADGEGEDDDD